MPSVPSSHARDIITAHGGRITRARIAVLEALHASARPQSHDEIAQALRAAGIAHDRVTLYRALDWLVAQGIARRIAGAQRAWRFEAAHGGSHRHAHFHCDRCGQVLCLEDVQPEAGAAHLPGYRIDRAELVLHGACPGCSPNLPAHA